MIKAIRRYMNFTQLNLLPELQEALRYNKFSTATEIQAQAIPFILDKRDILATAQTGTGKTFAFALPTLQNLMLENSIRDKKNKRAIRVLVLTPTRELAIQVLQGFQSLSYKTNVKTTAIYGGVPQRKQEPILKAGVDILIATPGRLVDLINQGLVHLDNIEMLILDEADRMLDMGFIHDVKRILAQTPEQKQTMLFSATMPKSVRDFSKNILKKPQVIEVSPKEPTVDRIEQSVYFVRNKASKRQLLLDLLHDQDVKSAIVFTRTKHGADRVVKDLMKQGISCAAIHGNKSQNARVTTLRNFKNHNIRILVATDIAARGIDIESLGHVFNYDLPDIPESYVHRIGRTGRAGQLGNAITFCEETESQQWQSIENFVGKKIEVCIA